MPRIARCGGVVGGAMVASLVFTAGVAHGATGSTTEQHKLVTGAPSSTVHTAKPAAQDSALPEGVSLAGFREAAARLLEASSAYRTIFDDGAPRLLDTKFLGPLRQKPGLFSPIETFYCASAKIDGGPIPFDRVTLLRIGPSKDGRLKIVAQTGLNQPPSGCWYKKGYGPFPELATLRQKRRHDLGKKD